MINRATYDAWRIKPPCELEGICNRDCPYYDECGDSPREDED